MVITALLTVIAVLAISWISTCGIVYLIALCFKFAFDWALATGIWLVLLLLGGLFNKG